jgi:tetraacyldisaccharide 4'-kinase
MREPAFWWRPQGAASALLAPLGVAYGAVAAWRMGRPGRDAGIPVVCVGNLTLGGAGKTPTAIAVARILADAGRNPVLLSRGYGGQRHGPVRVDPAVHRAADVGDEPLLLARAAPTIVARDRVGGAEAARQSGAGTIVMDDGFQNPALRKDLSIVVVDGRRGIGNARVFPAGPLRAPLSAQLERAQAVLVIGEGDAATGVEREAQRRGLPVLHGRLEPDTDALAALREVPVLAFAGIGDPEKFAATLRQSQIDVRELASFPDHHAYSAAEAHTLIERARSTGLALVTTEKDLARLSGSPGLKPLADAARALPVTLAVSEVEAFRSLVLAA